MKTNYLFSLLLLGIIIPELLNADPIPGNQDGSTYLLPAPDLSRFSAGIYLQARAREVKAHNIKNKLETRRTAGYLAYDILPWLSIYGTAMDSKQKFIYETNEGSTEIGGGIILNIIDHEVMSPTLLEDIVRLTAMIQYTKGEYFFFRKSEDLNEIYGALTLHIINEVDGNKLYWPNAIGFFVGPVYSKLDGENIEEAQAYGFSLGLEIYFTDRVTLNLGTEQFDQENKYLYGLHVRF